MNAPLLYFVYTGVSKKIFEIFYVALVCIYQPLHMGRMWSSVNF